MKMFRGIFVAVSGLFLASGVVLAQGQAVPSQELPSFEEVFGIIRSNLARASQSELNRAAVAGLLEQLQSRVTLLANEPAVSSSTSEGNPISKATVYEDSFAYLRTSDVEAGLAKALLSAYEPLRAQNKLNGLILDLRFAEGQDYAASTEAAALFVAADRPLLKWDGGIIRSKAGERKIDVPMVVLVNPETAGAAEVLAAILRQSEVGLMIGGRTAGRAHQFKEFPLRNGQRLRLATGSIELGDGQTLAENGITPDIRIVVSREDELAYLADPYKVLPKLFAQAVRPDGANGAPGVTPRAPRRRINESELLRMQREGVNGNLEMDAGGDERPPKPVINDPALARAIDFLKGLALVQSRR